MSPSLSPRLAPAAEREWQFPVTHRRALIKPRCWQPLIAARREGGGSRRVRNEGRGQGQGWMCQPRLRLQLGSRVAKGTVAQHWARSWPGGQAHPAAGQPASPWGHWPASGATGQLARRSASTQPTGQPPTSHLPATYQPAGQAARLRQLASRPPVTRPAGQPVLSAASKAISQRALTGRLPATSHRATRLARPPAGQLRSQAGHRAASQPATGHQPPAQRASQPTRSIIRPPAGSPVPMCPSPPGRGVKWGHLLPSAPARGSPPCRVSPGTRSLGSSSLTPVNNLCCPTGWPWWPSSGDTSLEDAWLVSSLATGGQPGEEVPARASCLLLGVAGGASECTDTRAGWRVGGGWVVAG